MQFRVLCTVESRDRWWCHSVTCFNDSARLEVEKHTWNFVLRILFAYKLVCFMSFSACLIRSSGSFVHGKTSLDSFTSVFCHVEFL